MQFQFKIKPTRVVTMFCTPKRSDRHFANKSKNDRSKYSPIHWIKVKKHNVF